MQIHDSSPERRNLIILSMSIIVFYLAGGKLIDNSVKLQLINITFSKPDVLIYLVWILLLWFCYRYWLTMQGSWKKDLRDEIFSLPIPSFFYHYFMKKFNLSNDNFLDSPKKNKYWFKIHAKYHFESFQVQHIYKTDSGEQKSEFKEMSTKIDKLIILGYILYLFFRKPTLSTYTMPYFLCTLAIALGIFHAL